MADPNPIPQWDARARDLAHRAVDLLFDHISSVAGKPVVAWRSGESLRDEYRLDDAPPGSADPLRLIESFARDSIQLHHPRYMGHQVCPPFPLAAIADFVISALNQSVAVWEMSPAATVIERELTGWLARRAGYGPEAEGTAVSGGSAANLTALLAARARWRREHEADARHPVILCSTDAHYSVARAAGVLGIPESDVLRIPTDAAHALDLDALDSALAALEASDSHAPMAIVATAGSTATGAFDRLGPIADMRDRYRSWLHVDAAHGGSVLLSPSLAPLAAGIDRSDSLSWDPHKMLWMPLSLGVVLVRSGIWLRAAFEADAPYLFHRDSAEANLGEMTLQCSKRADAVKLWLALSTLGTAPFAAALERVAALTRHLHDSVAASDDFAPMHEPQFNIFCFRWAGDGSLSDEELDEANGRLRRRVIESGEAWITSTLLRGRRVLRTTIINPATTEADLDAMLATLRREAAKPGEPG
jgi:L-2,4-diaminobutyrate decarboxylase